MRRLNAQITSKASFIGVLDPVDDAAAIQTARVELADKTYERAMAGNSLSGLKVLE